MLDESEDGGPSYLVAAKTVLDSAKSLDAAKELQSESLMMSQVGHHPNLVSIVGVVTRGDPLILILSYCEHGSLLSLLRLRTKEMSPLGVNAKLKLGLETAQGMEFLTSKLFIHRDLAARNVLVATGMVAQVADFGLSRGMVHKQHRAARRSMVSDGSGDNADPNDNGNDYYRSQKGVFPVRWTAPEAMQDLVFTVASDVWSFGILMVEMYQNGQEPYHDLKIAEVMAHVIAGNQHSRPAECSPAMYELLCSCWATDPSERPSFVAIVGVLSKTFQELNKIVSLPPTAPRSELNGAVARIRASQQNVNPYEYSEAIAATSFASTSVATYASMPGRSGNPYEYSEAIAASLASFAESGSENMSERNVLPQASGDLVAAEREERNGENVYPNNNRFREAHDNGAAQNDTLPSLLGVPALQENELTADGAANVDKKGEYVELDLRRVPSVDFSASAVVPATVSLLVDFTAM